jgi:hypothetical protein
MNPRHDGDHHIVELSMKKPFLFGMTLVSGLLVMGQAYAQSAFETHMTECVSKFANANDAATVMLECTAGGGKLSDCKVVENSTPNKGFEKAAVCVATALPVGSKTGAIRVPIRFAGA